MITVQFKKKKAAEHYTQYNLILKTRMETKPVHVKYTCTLKSQERNLNKQLLYAVSWWRGERRADHFYLQPITVSNLKPQ